MAFDSQTVVSNGSLTSLAITLDYLSRDEISVSYDDVNIPTNSGQWGWVGTVSKTMVFTPSPANGVVVKVQRTTQLASMYHKFSEGAQFLPKILDENFDQLLHLVQEGGGGGGASGVSSVNTRVGDVVINSDDIVDALGYVPADNAGTAGVSSFNTRIGAVTLQLSDVTALGYPPPGGGGSSSSINVKDYGAVGNGVTADDAAVDAAIAAALASGGKALYFPAGEYLLNQPHDITNMSVFGDPRSFGEQFQSRLKTTTNVTLFTCTTGRASLHSLAFVGSNNPAHNNNIAFKFINSSNVRVEDCDFFFWYTHLQSVGECFYTQVSHCQMYNHRNIGVECVGNTDPGFDAHFSDIMMNSTTGVNGFKFTHAGSVTMADVVITPNGMSGATVLFESDAPLSGVHQISNCVFESGTIGLHLKGTVSQSVKFVFVTNSYIASSSDKALLVDYARVRLGSSYFTSNQHAVYISGDGDVSMSNCEFQVLGVPITAALTATAVRLSVMAPAYAGGFQFVYLPFLPLANVKRVDVLGGAIGSNVNPIDLPPGTVPGVRWADGAPMSAVAGVSSFNTRSGAVVLNNPDIASGMATGTPTLLSTASTLRATGRTLPASGTGLELSYVPADNTSYVVSYDRTASQYKSLSLDAAAITFRSGAMVLDSSGNLLVNKLTSTGAYKLQVTGDTLVTGASYADTPSSGTTGNRVATCDFVNTRLAGAAVTSFNTRVGAVTLNSTDVSNANGALLSGANFSGNVNVSSHLRATGSSTPGSGAGLEMSYDSGSGASYIVSYDRGAGQYKFLNIDSQSVSFRGTRMIIGSDDNVLIGYGSSNGAYRLQVNGQIFATNATIATSDMKFKENIKPLEQGLDAVLALRPRTYQFRPSEKHNFPQGTQVGFVAQEVDAVLRGTDYAKSVVTTIGDAGDELGRMKGLAEAKLIPLLVKAIQELHAEVQALKAKE